MWILSWILFQSFEFFLINFLCFFIHTLKVNWCPVWVGPQSSSNISFCVPQKRVWNDVRVSNRIFIFGWAIPLNPNGLLTFSRWTFVKRSLSSQSSQCHKLIETVHFRLSFPQWFPCDDIFQPICVWSSADIVMWVSKTASPFNKVPLVLLNISLPALLFHTPPLFHALIKETEHGRMKERIIKMRSDSRFQPFVMNIP